MAQQSWWADYSIADRGHVHDSEHAAADASLPVLSHVCTACSAKFPSYKALSGHMRMVHKVRSPLRLFISSPTCPACLTTFSCRLSCLKHVGDSRRPKCRELLLAGSFPQLSVDECAELDALDTKAKTAAKRLGHSHILSTKAAVTIDGKIRGVCKV